MFSINDTFFVNIFVPEVKKCQNDYESFLEAFLHTRFRLRKFFTVH